VAVAYDGSESAGAALEAAVERFPGRRLLVISVWEPGLAMAMAPLSDPIGVSNMAPSAEEMRVTDEVQQRHAVDIARDGVGLVHELGAEAEAVPVADDRGVAVTILQTAASGGVCAVVVGSRGRGRMKTRLFGSTTQHLLSHSPLPIVVVRERPDAHAG